MLNSQIRDKRVYQNLGNEDLIKLLTPCSKVLDVGCGNGANARLIADKYPDAQVSGVTIAQTEADASKPYLKKCYVFDMESSWPDQLQEESYDALIFSHVLEHLRDPALVVAKYVQHLQSGGQILIAVPNVLNWRQRIDFALGRFEYESAGVMDDTHLRFFTYLTSDRYLLSRCKDVSITHKLATGSVPLWLLRRAVLPSKWSDFIDKNGTKFWPNLFGSQVVFRGIKR